MKGVIQRAVGFYEAVEQTGFTVSLRFRENAEEMTERIRIQELNVKGCRDARHWKQMKYVFFFPFSIKSSCSGLLWLSGKYFNYHYWRRFSNLNITLGTKIKKKPNILNICRQVLQTAKTYKTFGQMELKVSVQSSIDLFF